MQLRAMIATACANFIAWNCAKIANNETIKYSLNRAELRAMGLFFHLKINKLTVCVTYKFMKQRQEWKYLCRFLKITCFHGFQI